MVHRILEFLTRLLYARRIRHVEKVGRAATMAKTGDPEAALAHLAEIERHIHPKVLSFLAYTRARILDQLGRESEAESEMIRAAKIDPANFQAHLEIARMSGRRFHFKNAKARLEGLLEVPDEAVCAAARTQLTAIEEIRSGKAVGKLSRRAEQVARTPVPPKNVPLGLPVDLEALDAFISTAPEKAADMLEDLAVLLGESAAKTGGTWQVSLSLSHSFISFPNAPPFYPFEAIAYRLSGGSISDLKYTTSKSK